MPDNKVFIVAQEKSHGVYEVFVNRAGSSQYIRTGLTVKKGDEMDRTLRSLKQQWERTGMSVEVKIVGK